MIRLERLRLPLPHLAALVLVALAIPSRPVAAAVPNPPFSVVDRVVVGSPSGELVTLAFSGHAGFWVIVRDVNNMPIPGSTVTLDFSTSGVRGFAAQNPGTTLNCAARTMSRVSDATGRAVFGPRFGGYDNGFNVEVSADGVILAMVPARSLDIVPNDGRTGIPDLNAFVQGYFPCPACPPCATCPQLDFDASGGPLDLNDLAIFAKEYLLNLSAQAYCW